MKSVLRTWIWEPSLKKRVSKRPAVIIINNYRNSLKNKTENKKLRKVKEKKVKTKESFKELNATLPRAIVFEQMACKVGQT